MHNGVAFKMLSNESGKLYAIIVIMIIIASVSLAFISLNPLQPASQTSIDIISADGEVETVSLSDMLGMTVIEGTTSFQNSYGNVRGSGSYRGVKIADLLELVGGMEEEQLLTVNASDGYSIKFNYGKVFPNNTAYDLQGDMVLAFEYNGTLVPEWEEGFRLIFIPEDGYYDNSDAESSTPIEIFPDAAGPQCVENVAKIILENPEPSALQIINYDKSYRFSMNELQSLDNITGEGAYIKSTGTVVGPFTYTGVVIETLLSQIGNVPVEYSLEVIASDGYKTYFTQDQVEGNFTAYDPITKESLGPKNFTLTLAYYEGGEPLSTELGGPLRFVTLSNDGYLTDSHYWAKDVVKINIMSGVTPWELQLDGVEVWNMTHDVYYSLASCEHHRTDVSYDGHTYVGVPLYIIVAAFDGADDEHYQFNMTLIGKNYDVVVYDNEENNDTIEVTVLAGNKSIIVAGWMDDALLEGEMFPLLLVSPDGLHFLGPISKVQMIDWDI